MKLANTNNNAAFDFSAAFASLDSKIKEQDAAIADAQKKTEEAKKARELILATDTDIYVALAQGGKIAVNSGNFGGMLNKTAIYPAATNKGEKLTSAEAGMMAVAVAVQTAQKADAKHVAIYTNGSNVLRISGMIGRIKQGSDIVLTEGEKKHIVDRMATYGKNYAAICKSVFLALKAAFDGGKVVSVHGVDELGTAPLQYRLPADAADSIVTMKRGYGHVTVNGRSYTVKSRNSYLTGEFKLVADNMGRIAIEDPIDEAKAPAKAFASKLFRLASRDVSIVNQNENAASVLSEVEAEAKAA